MQMQGALGDGQADAGAATLTIAGIGYTVEGAKEIAQDSLGRVFGKRGSAPGRFGVVTGIAVDRDGNILVVDKLRCVVMIFEHTNFALLKEFGNRGFRPGNLIGPDDILIDSQNRAYVSSLRKRGISVYQLTSN